MKTSHSATMVHKWMQLYQLVTYQIKAIIYVHVLHLRKKLDTDNTTFSVIQTWQWFFHLRLSFTWDFYPCKKNVLICSILSPLQCIIDHSHLQTQYVKLELVGVDLIFLFFMYGKEIIWMRPSFWCHVKQTTGRYHPI